MNRKEIKLDGVENDRYEYFAKYFYRLFLSSDEENEIYEYDLAELGDANLFGVIEQNHYLLLNKSILKKFYMYWRSKLLVLKSSEQLIRFDDESTIKLSDLASFFILIVNPNFASAWCRRRSNLIESRTFLNELKLNRIILMKYFKSEQAFIHRRWLFRNYVINQSGDDLKDLYLREIDFLIDKIVPKVKSNYYCWSFLNWLLSHRILLDNRSLLDDLFKRYTSLIYLNPSDNCIFHSRLHLIHLIVDESNHRDLIDDAFVQRELILFDDLLVRYPFYMTIWNYRKYFFLFLRATNEKRSFRVNIAEMNVKLGESIDALYRISEIDDLKESDDRLENLLNRELKLSKLVEKLNMQNQTTTQIDLIQQHANKYEIFFNKFIKF